MLKKAFNKILQIEPYVNEMKSLTLIDYFILKPYSFFTTGSSAGASASGSGPEGRWFNSTLPD